MNAKSDSNALGYQTDPNVESDAGGPSGRVFENGVAFLVFWTGLVLSVAPPAVSGRQSQDEPMEEDDVLEVNVRGNAVNGDVEVAEDVEMDVSDRQEDEEARMEVDEIRETIVGQDIDEGNKGYVEMDWQNAACEVSFVESMEQVQMTGENEEIVDVREQEKEAVPLRSCLRKNDGGLAGRGKKCTFSKVVHVQFHQRLVAKNVRKPYVMSGQPVRREVERLRKPRRVMPAVQRVQLEEVREIVSTMPREDIVQVGHPAGPVGCVETCVERCDEDCHCMKNGIDCAQQYGCRCSPENCKNDRFVVSRWERMRHLVEKRREGNKAYAEMESPANVTIESIGESLLIDEDNVSRIGEEAEEQDVREPSTAWQDVTGDSEAGIEEESDASILVFKGIKPIPSAEFQEADNLLNVNEVVSPDAISEVTVESAFVAADRLEEAEDDFSGIRSIADEAAPTSILGKLKNVFASFMPSPSMPMIVEDDSEKVMVAVEGSSVDVVENESESVRLDLVRTEEVQDELDVPEDLKIAGLDDDLTDNFVSNGEILENRESEQIKDVTCVENELESARCDLVCTVEVQDELDVPEDLSTDDLTHTVVPVGEIATYGDLEKGVDVSSVGSHLDNNEMNQDPTEDEDNIGKQSVPFSQVSVFEDLADSVVTSGETLGDNVDDEQVEDVIDSADEADDINFEPVSSNELCFNARAEEFPKRLLELLPPTLDEKAVDSCKPGEWLDGEAVFVGLLREATKFNVKMAENGRKCAVCHPLLAMEALRLAKQDDEEATARKAIGSRKRKAPAVLKELDPSLVADLVAYGHLWTEMIVPMRVAGTHWVLGMVKRNAVQAVILDSLPAPLEKKEVMKGCVMKVLQALGELNKEDTTTKKYKVSCSPHHDIQSDDSSCGIYTIIHSRRVLSRETMSGRKRKIDDAIDVNEERKRLTMDLTVAREYFEDMGRKNELWSHDANGPKKCVPANIPIKLRYTTRK